ncbi:uncharacterized protein LOC117554698 [Gymnodraco acuticeps]|uniref:Uncharacterized protein LOC117554698 n=1 Tax=Gymnodraco acuticeps TaxID=8218 RepID=A0A6P8V4C0_GYMAC|nr:uncharacterized protein LOC117554698 [Gymnodraco acuticeps]
MFGFPKGGSLSKLKIKNLRDKLQECEDGIKKKSRIKGKDLEKLDSHRKCLKYWEDEAECRERRQLAAAIRKIQVDDKGEEKEKNSFIPPPKYKPHTSLYPSLYTGVEDPLLDCGFPFPPPPPPVHLPAEEAEEAAGGEVTAKLERTVQEKKEKREREEKEAELYRKEHPRKPDQDLNYNLPMIQVAGPAGPSLVYRPWTISDMREIAKDHIPDVELGGAKFAAALNMFCRQFTPTMPEIKTLLTLRMGPTHVSHFAEILGGQQHVVAPLWDDDLNNTYRTALARLEAAITTKFPAKVDMSRIWACKQTPEETVNYYFHRLEKVFTENSGIIKQEAGAQGVAEIGVWETHLTNAFLNGLSPAISASVRNSCIGVMEGARLEEIRRHAVHAEKRLLRRKSQRGK